MTTFHAILPWAMSCVTITSLWLQGSKWPHAWKLTLANQVLWLEFIRSTGAYGLLPMTAAIVFVALRNNARWGRQ